MVMNAKTVDKLDWRTLQQFAPTLYDALRKIVEANCSTCHALRDVGCVSPTNCLFKYGREAIEQAGGYT